MNRTAKGWLTDARSHINAAIEMLEKQTDLDQTDLIISHVSDARLAMNKAANALPGVPSTFAFPPDPDPEGLAQIAKLDAAEHVEWIVQQSINLPNVHIGLLQGHKAVITNTGIGNAVWQVEIRTFIATFDSLERAKQSAEIVLRDRAKRVSVMWLDRDQFAWVNPNITDPTRVPSISPPNPDDDITVNWTNLGPAAAPPSDPRINDYEVAYKHALTLADTMNKLHYRDNYGWKPEGDLPGLIMQIDNMVAGLGRNAPDPVPQLSADYQALKDAGNAMAAASFRVATEYDGCHRLMLAVSDWAIAVANEGGRGNAS